MKGIILKAYPTKQQLTLIKKTTGCRRFVYNYFLFLKDKEWEENKKKLSDFDCDKLLTQLKKTPDHLWLNEVPCIVLHQSIRDLEQSYKNWWRDLKKSKNQQRFKHPKFHSRYGVAQNLIF